MSRIPEVKREGARVVYRYGNQDKQIAKFLANRKFVLGFLENAKDTTRVLA